MRWVALALVALALPAHGAPAKGVVLPVRAAGIPPSLVVLADESLRRVAEARGGCALVSQAAVADMAKMLVLPAEPGDEDLTRLARSLLARWAVEVTLVAQGQQVRVRVAVCSPSGACVTQSSMVPAAGMLSTLERLVGEVLGAAPSTQPAAASQPSSRSVTATRPASQPAVGRPGAAPASPPVVGRPGAAPSVAPVPAASVRKPVRRRRATRALLAAGLRGYYLKSWERGGPITELEVGGLTDLYRAGALFRVYFGDRTGYYLGGRGEVGPRLGPLRLSFGADFGMLFIPDTFDNLDMMILNLHPAGVVFELGPVVLHLDVFSLDLYLVPINEEIGRDPDFLYGFSSGVTVGVRL